MPVTKARPHRRDNTDCDVNYVLSRQNPDVKKLTSNEEILPTRGIKKSEKSLHDDIRTSLHVDNIYRMNGVLLVATGLASDNRQTRYRPDFLRHLQSGYKCIYMWQQKHNIMSYFLNVCVFLYNLYNVPIVWFTRLTVQRRRYGQYWL